MKKYFFILPLIASCNGLGTPTLNYNYIDQNNPIDGEQTEGNVSTKDPKTLEFISGKSLLKQVLGKSIKIDNKDKDNWIKINTQFKELRRLVKIYKNQFEVPEYVENVLLNCWVDEYKNELSPVHLYAAVSINYPQLVKEIAPYVDVHGPVGRGSYENKTSLHRALSKGYLDIIDILLPYVDEKNVNLSDKDGSTYLHLTVNMRMFDKSCNETFHHNEKKLAICKTLLEKGANPNLPGGRYYRWTPIQYAIENSCVENNYYDIIKLLIKKGSDLTTTNGTILHSAVYHKKFELAKFLVKQGVDPNLRNESGETILHSAVYHKKFELAKFLVKQGVDPNLRNESGETILHNAAWCKGNISFVKFLIENKASPDIIGNDGDTPLHNAARNDNPAVLEFLLQNKADSSIIDKHGRTIFHSLVYWNYVDKVNLLLKQKVNINLKDKYGRTPIYYAAKYSNGSSEDNLRIIKLLLEEGADLNITDIYDDSPLTYAKSKNNLAMVNLILEWQKNQKIDGNARKE